MARSTFEETLQKISTGQSAYYNYHETIGDGIPLVPLLNKDNVLELQKNLVVRPSDIFVTSYNRSGTNWICYIVQLIMNGGVPLDKDLTELGVFVEILKLSQVEAMSSPRCMKCHLPYDLVVGGTPHTTKGKYIYSYRNPRDVAFSFYCMIQSLEAVPPTWSKLLDDFIKGNITYGSQLDHIKGWWKHKDSPNILFLSYEEMKKDTVGAVQSISLFLGYEYNEQVIEEIAFRASFDEMKKNLQSNNSSLVNFKLVRKGVIGDWRSHFSTEDIAKMDAAVKEKLGDTDIVFDYGDNVS